ncbi:MAG: alpha/beta fold hydrolase [Chitinophagaceae bacterium]
MNENKKRRWKKWLTIIIVIYILGGAAIYYLQDYVLFHPEPMKKEDRYNFSQPHKEFNIPVNKESNLNIIQFTTNDSLPKGVVLYFHGNKKNISWYARFAPYFTKLNYEVWMIDYPGFGKSTGGFTEQSLYHCADQLYKFARSRFNADSIIVYGKSLGTCVAAQVAATHNCKRLILETPYYSMTSLANRYLFMYPVDWLFKYKLPEAEYLQKVEVPVTMFHGTDDGVIPYSNASRLKEAMKKTDEFVTIDGGSHNDLFDFPQTIAKIDSLLK